MGVADHCRRPDAAVGLHSGPGRGEALRGVPHRTDRVGMPVHDVGLDRRQELGGVLMPFALPALRRETVRHLENLRRLLLDQGSWRRPDEPPRAAVEPSPSRRSGQVSESVSDGSSTGRWTLWLGPYKTDCGYGPDARRHGTSWTNSCSPRCRGYVGATGIASATVTVATAHLPSEGANYDGTARTGVGIQ